MMGHAFCNCCTIAPASHPCFRRFECMHRATVAFCIYAEDMTARAKKPGLVDSWFATALTTRRLVRLPIAMYRIGLGFVFGRRVLMVEHLGRTSHQRRFVVLEVAERSDTVISVASGFGRSAQWYRNIEANGVVFVSTGFRRRVPATARLLTRGESDPRLTRYAELHPTAWQHLEAAMREIAGGDPEILIVDLTLPSA